MRSEGFLQLGQFVSRTLLRQSKNFSDFCKVLSQFDFYNMIVPLLKSQTGLPVGIQAPPPTPTHAFLTRQALPTPLPLQFF